MKLRIAGYVLLLTGFIWAGSILWPALHGKYPFMPPQTYKVPEDTGEMVSRHELFMWGQAMRHQCFDERARMLHPLLLMVVGAVVLDLAGRRRRKKSPNKKMHDIFAEREKS